MKSCNKTRHMISWGHERGQSLTEIAVLAPVLILILLGAVDLGRAYDAYVTITNASREGARYGAANPTDTSGIQTRTVNEALNSGISINSGQVTVACASYGSTSFTLPCSSAYNGDQLRVTVQYTFQFITTEIVSNTSFTMSNYTIMAVLNGLQ